MILTKKGRPLVRTGLCIFNQPLTALYRANRLACLLAAAAAAGSGIADISNAIIIGIKLLSVAAVRADIKSIGSTVIV